MEWKVFKHDTGYHGLLNLEVVFKKEYVGSFIFKTVLILNLSQRDIEFIEAGYIDNLFKYTYQDFLNQPF